LLRNRDLTGYEQLALPILPSFDSIGELNNEKSEKKRPRYRQQSRQTPIIGTTTHFPEFSQ
jgi:hypothetical protein